MRRIDRPVLPVLEVDNEARLYLRLWEKPIETGTLRRVDNSRFGEINVDHAARRRAILWENPIGWERQLCAEWPPLFPLIPHFLTVLSRIVVLLSAGFKPDSPKDWVLRGANYSSVHKVEKRAESERKVRFRPVLP